MFTGPVTTLKILVCDRRVPALAGTWPTVATVFREMGHSVTVVADDPCDLGQFDLVVQWANPGYFPRFRKHIRGIPSEHRPPIAVLYTEPLPPPRASGLPRWSGLNAVEIGKILLNDWRATDIYSNAFKLRRMMREGSIDMLFMLGGEQQEYAAEQGYESWRYDYGYHPSFGRLLGGERDVDVLFLGETRPRRRRALLNRLREQGVNVLVRGSWNDREAGLWGEERTRFLNRTKILVHLQRYPGKLAGKRFILGMANGAMVISEPVYRPEPFVDREHYASATIEKMPEVIRHFLANPAERERIAQAGHRFITRDLTFTRVMKEVLSVVEERLAERQR